MNYTHLNMKKTITLSAIVCTLSMNAQTKINYPETKKIDHVDTYFGEQINDVYRWLEDDRSPETEAWVKARKIYTLVQGGFCCRLFSR